MLKPAGQFFVAPDNGVLSMIYDWAKPKVRVISNPRLMLRQVSRTFHGRDVFAPAAAHLAQGIPTSRFGKLISDFIRSPRLQPAPISSHNWAGIILKVDRFGNLITNFHIDDFPDVKTRPFEMRVGTERIHRLALTYSDTSIGEVFAIVGSSGYIEIAANQASAAKLLGCGPGAEVQLEIYA